MLDIFVPSQRADTESTSPQGRRRDRNRDPRFL